MLDLIRLSSFAGGVQLGLPINILLLRVEVFGQSVLFRLVWGEGGKCDGWDRSLG